LLSLEIFNDSFRAGSARSVAIDGQRSLLFTLDELQRRTGVPVAGLPSLPARAHCRGIDFIEFAMDESAGAKFEAALEALGFAKAGVHKSKMVTRWRQGDINIVVNCDKDGFAHSFNITHGRLRHSPEGRRCGGDARARGPAPRPAVPAGREERRGLRSGGARSRRQSRLFH
jgi:4-hydroxyphenylpyruvate dioxygenase